MNLLFANDRRGEYPPSYYAATAVPPGPWPAAEGRLRADVAVVGGGYTGLSAAIHLVARGYDVIVLEAQRMGFGASGRNGGQMGSGQRQEQDVLEARHGREDARRLWDLAEEAKRLTRRLAEAGGVPVHPGIAHACETAAELRHSHAMAEKLAQDYAYPHVEPLDRAGIRRLIGSDRFIGGDIDRGAGHLHPLAYAFGLARQADRLGVRLHEGTQVTAIHPGRRVRLTCETGAEVEADHLILACNGYLGGLDRRVAARVMPINNYIVATEPLGDRAKEILSENVAVADGRFVVDYWRLSDDGRLLFGGGETLGYRFPQDIAAVVRKPMLRIYPQLADVRIDHAWGGTLAITLSRMPYFRRLEGNVLTACGYSGHGVAMATLAGQLLAEATAGAAERFDLMARLPAAAFPGGPMMRQPLLVLAMAWYGLRDRLGI